MSNLRGHRSPAGMSLALVLGTALVAAGCSQSGPSTAPTDEMMEHSAAPTDAMMEHSAAPTDAMMEHSDTP